MPYSKTVDKYKGVERRQCPRLDEDNYFILYNLQNRNNEKIKESLINNISVNGLCFDILEMISPGVNLECEIYQRQKDIFFSIFILAKVIWIREIGNCDELGSNKYKIGLKFVRISSADKERNAKYINERIGSR